MITKLLSSLPLSREFYMFSNPPPTYDEAVMSLRQAEATLALVDLNRKKNASDQSGSLPTPASSLHTEASKEGKPEKFTNRGRGRGRGKPTHFIPYQRSSREIKCYRCCKGPGTQ